MQFWTVDLTISRVQFCTAQQTTKTARGGARALPLPSPRFIVCWVPPPRHTHTHTHTQTHILVPRLTPCRARVQAPRHAACIPYAAQPSTPPSTPLPTPRLPHVPLQPPKPSILPPLLPPPSTQPAMLTSIPATNRPRGRGMCSSVPQAA